MVWMRHAQDRAALRRELIIDCQVVSERDFRLLGTRTWDLSPDGLLLQADDFAEVGEPVLFSVRIPHSREWLDGHGRVARLVRGLRDTDRGPGLGIAFTDVDGMTRARLAGALRRVPPAVPARRVRKDYAATITDIFGGQPNLDFADVYAPRETFLRV
jgi:hypothetical protein